MCTRIEAPNGVELTLEFETHQSASDMLFKVADTHILVGYLVHDTDCQDPSDNDGQGKIFSASRQATKESREGYRDALGLDEDFKPDLGLVEDDAIVALIHEDIRLSFEGDRVLFEKCFEYAFENYLSEEKETRIEFVFRSLNDLEDMADFLDVDSYKISPWAKGRLDGTIGNKYAVVLDVYEHSGIAYSIAGSGTQCQFDTARGGAVWVPDACAIENFGEKSAHEYAKSCVETYSAWANGECYGYVIEKHPGGHVESCWGFIGNSDAQEQLKEAFENGTFD